MRQFPMSAFLAAVIGLAGVAQAPGQEGCRPGLAVRDVYFSQMRLPTMERKWSAVVSVDTSRCPASATGAFDIVFLRSKEIGPEIEFRERFTWRAPSVNVSVDFWADEAVERFWIENIAPCACAG